MGIATESTESTDVNTVFHREVMDMLVEEQLSYRVRGCVYEVSRELGGGFLEKVYENALMREFALRGLTAQAQVPLSVTYKGHTVGQYFVDMMVEDRILLELKAQEELPPSSQAQLINYLRASGRKIGMLINFTSPKAVIKRIVL